LQREEKLRISLAFAQRFAFGGMSAKDLGRRQGDAAEKGEGERRRAAEFERRLETDNCPFVSTQSEISASAINSHGNQERRLRPWPRLATNYCRLSSLGYAGLRGEGSIPGPLPPPNCAAAPRFNRSPPTLRRCSFLEDSRQSDCARDCEGGEPRRGCLAVDGAAACLKV
jgi:hypothetical protein